MDKKTEEFIHKKSLFYADMFKRAYNSIGEDHPITKSLLDQYRSLRRQLPGDLDEDGHSTRFGATEAYRTTQDD